jgi:2,3-dihydroxybiphenyl 1,2-dioxygenase
MTPIKIISLGYMGVNVIDFGAWRQFAGDLLALQTVTVAEHYRALRLDDRAQRVILQKAGQDGGAYYGFEVADAAALTAAADYLANRGIDVTPGSPAEAEIRQVTGMIHFADPAGNRIELFHDLAAAAQPFAPPRPIGGFITAEFGLGHVVLFAPDYEPMRAFYLDLLGFQLSDYCERPFRATFMHVNARHHTLALIERPASGLHHLMLEWQYMDDVGRAYDIALKQSERISVTLGRHGNDHMLSFYANSPSKFMVECGWGGRVIDEHWQAGEFFGPSLWGHERNWLKGPARAEAQRLLDLAAQQGELAPLQVRSGPGFDLSIL